MTALTAESRGMLPGLIGVIAFSLTLPATRAAVDPPSNSMVFLQSR
jgi:hypothetical protein